MNKNKRHLYLWIILVLILAINIVRPSYISNAADKAKKKVTIVYFYMSVCPACDEAGKALKNVTDAEKAANSNFEISVITHNTADQYALTLVQKYFEVYKVPKDDQNDPIVFIGDKYFYGENDIKNGLIKELENENIAETKVLDLQNEDEKRVEDKFSAMKGINVFLVGLVNGFNPCSLSMLLFFVSMLLARQASIKKTGFAYIAGKFIMYLLLGTILFDVLVKFQIGWYKLATKIVIAILIAAVAGLNIKDFFAARKEEYDKIKNQLPKDVKKFNYEWIKKIINASNERTILQLSFFIGVIISVGEFLCTGQIYLATIVYVLKGSSTMSFRAFLYLLIYDIAFILPLVVITILIDKGSAIFDVSEVLRAKLPLIKLINAAVFLILGIIIILIL